MSKRRATTTGPGSLTIDLFATGMTPLHRVGLAGLAMTLRALDHEGADLADLGSWEISDQAVTLRWPADGKAFSAALLERSFRLTEQGLIWFPALGHPLDHPGSGVVLHNALLTTFLQHPRSRASTTKTVRSVTVEIDGESQALTYLPLDQYAHQRAAYEPTRPLRVAGWLYPGGAVRHVQASNETSLVEDPARGLALLFAPVGAIYFQISRRTEGVRPQYCLVVPRVRDLTAYLESRQIFAHRGVAELQVAGSAEAAVRVLSELEAHDLVRDTSAESCTVMAFGTVPWSPQQKTRVEIFTVAAGQVSNLRTYRLARSAFPPPRLMSSRPDPRTGVVRHWWVVSQVPDFIATNVVAGVPWWRGFADLWRRLRDAAGPEQRDWALHNEREGLRTMVHDTRALPEGPDVRLVRACQEAWRRRLGELGERARDHGLDFTRLASREYEQVRISFARCKNAAMLRQTLTDFWSRAGSLPDLQDAWPDILPFLQTRWKDGRDLALLALASYKPQSTHEEVALTGPEQLSETGGTR